MHAYTIPGFHQFHRKSRGQQPIVTRVGWWGVQALEDCVADLCATGGAAAGKEFDSYTRPPPFYTRPPPQPLYTRPAPHTRHANQLYIKIYQDIMYMAGGRQHPRTAVSVLLLNTGRSPSASCL